MSDDDSDIDAGGEVDESGDERDGIDRAAVLSYLRYGTLAVAAVVALVAGAGLYASLGSIVDVWVADRYQPIARAGLNLVVLCVAVGGALAVLRRS